MKNKKLLLITITINIIVIIFLRLNLEYNFFKIGSFLLWIIVFIPIILNIGVFKALIYEKRSNS